MKVALYTCESSDDHSKSPPIETQIERGKQWTTEEGHELVTIYEDNGYSGGDWKRPDWQQCVKDAQRHQWTALWCWNQDRLARDTEQFLWFYRNLRQTGVRIYEDTSADWIDMETLGGRVKHQTMAQTAEIFRLVTSEKVKAAYRRKKASGGAWGRPSKPLDVAKILSLRKKGLGYRAIAKQFGEISYQTVRRAIRRYVADETNDSHLLEKS